VSTQGWVVVDLDDQGGVWAAVLVATQRESAVERCAVEHVPQAFLERVTATEVVLLRVALSPIGSQHR